MQVLPRSCSSCADATKILYASTYSIQWAYVTAGHCNNALGLIGSPQHQQQTHTFKASSAASACVAVEQLSTSTCSPRRPVSHVSDWCRFCRSRFFGDSELFIHMQSAHEQCFLCRRAQPDRYVYYKDYNELEGEPQRALSKQALPLHPFGG